MNNFSDAFTSLASNYGWHDFVGNIGVVLVIWCYLRVQSGHMRSDSLRYSVGNGLGALLIMVSLLIDFNLSSFVIEIAWLGISVYGVYRYYYGRNGEETHGH